MYDMVHRTETSSKCGEEVQFFNFFPKFSPRDLEGSLTNHPYRKFIVHCFQATSLMRPVFLVSLFIVLLVYIFSLDGCGKEIVFTLFPLLHYCKDCCLFSWHSLGNACIIIAIVVATTYIFMMLYVFKQRFALLLCCGLAFGFPFGVLLAFLCFRCAGTLGIGVDYITFMVVLWNGVIVCAYVITADALQWECLQNACIMASTVSVSFIILTLDEGTILILSVLMVVWDIFAVYSSLGPIYVILWYRQQWVYMGEVFDLPQGLSFCTPFYELGSGDIIMLAVLVGRSAGVEGYATLICCICCAMVGLVCTVTHSVVEKRTVPALPAAISLGLVFYMLCRACDIQRFVENVAENGIFV